MLTKNFVLILLSNIILGAPMPMLIILGGLAGAAVSPVAYGATVPPTIQMLSGILVAAPISLYMGRRGRRAGFLLGVLLMVIGGGFGALSLFIESFVLLCIAHFLLGAALVAINFFRFAAAEVVEERWKSNAISLTLASGIIAAIVGPVIFNYSSDLVISAQFSGAYIAIALIGVVGSIPVLAMRKLPPVTAENAGIEVSKFSILRRPKVAFAISAAAVSQGIMVLLMTPTALAMVGYGFAHQQASSVIMWHVIAMFAPGFVTGMLIARFGATRIILTGLLLLSLSGIAALSGVTLVQFYLSLVLLGVGWNFGFIGSTTLLQASLAPEEGPLIQGTNDTLIALFSSLAALMSGALYVSIGWESIAVMAVATTVSTILIWLGFQFFRRAFASSDQPIAPERR
ncbi:MAG: MFS transporter [Granulosicoccus sp.]|nr:MFS transporter [Granulosicoccus sp.]